jgi:predicted nucleic acid-binding protein
MISAVLDACILYSATLRGFLLHLADHGLFEPFWSEEIQNEWTRSLLQNRPDLKQENLENTCRTMDVSFPSGLVHGYESIIPTLTLPDPKDRHVFAVAVQTIAEYIITFNLRDFPNKVLQSYSVKAVSPDEFIMRVIHDEPLHVLAAARDHRLSLTRPSKTVKEYLSTLEKQELSKTILFLQAHTPDI